MALNYLTLFQHLTNFCLDSKGFFNCLLKYLGGFRLYK